MCRRAEVWRCFFWCFKTNKMSKEKKGEFFSPSEVTAWHKKNGYGEKKNLEQTLNAKNVTRIYKEHLKLFCDFGASFLLSTGCNAVIREIAHHEPLPNGVHAISQEILNLHAAHSIFEKIIEELALEINKEKPNPDVADELFKQVLLAEKRFCDLKALIEESVTRHLVYFHTKPSESL